MRRMMLAALAAVAAAGGFGSAGVAQVSTQPLAPGEVLLEVVALGRSSAPADRATVTANVSASGETEAEAERALEAATERARAAAVAAGVRAEDISSSEALITFDVDMTAPEAPSEEPMPAVTRRRTLEIELGDLSRLDALRQALRDAGATIAGDPSFELSDLGPAQRAARADALRAAREQAEGYAASLGLRVVRIVRVTERVGMDMFTLFMSDPDLARRMQPNRVNTSRQVDNFMFVGVDFALAPR